MAKTFKFKIIKVVPKVLAEDNKTVCNLSPYYLLYQKDGLFWTAMYNDSSADLDGWRPWRMENFPSSEAAMGRATRWIKNWIESTERDRALKAHAKELKTVKTVVKVGEIRTDTLEWKDLS